MLKILQLSVYLLLATSAPAQFIVRGEILQKANLPAKLFCSVLNSFPGPDAIIDSAQVSPTGTFAFLFAGGYPGGTIFKITSEKSNVFHFPENALYCTNERTSALSILISSADELPGAVSKSGGVNEQLFRLASVQCELAKSMARLAKHTLPEGGAIALWAESQMLHNSFRRKIELAMFKPQSGAMLLLTLYFYCALNFCAADNSNRYCMAVSGRLPKTSLARAIQQELSSYPVE